MKKFTFLLLPCLCIIVNGYSQNRIKSWNINEISSIHVEINSPDAKIESLDFNDRSEISVIIDYLSDIELKDFKGTQLNYSNKDYFIKIICKGQHDQIYLYERLALVGKSSYLIDKEIVKKFENFIKNL